MSNGIDLQGNPLACNCSLQWMLNDLLPQLYVINPSILNNLRYLIQILLCDFIYMYYIIRN